MNQQFSARDALFVETLGEMAVVVNRVEALVPLLHDTRQLLIDANAQLSSQLRTFEDRTNAIAEHAKHTAVKHIAQRTDEMTRKAMQAEVLEIREAARIALGAELHPTLRELVAPLNRLAQQAYQIERPWQHWMRWLQHAATATVASAITWVAGIWLGLR